ncbi:hypothetical protein ACFX1X_030420 [Malus domestica]
MRKLCGESVDRRAEKNKSEETRGVGRKTGREKEKSGGIAAFGSSEKTRKKSCFEQHEQEQRNNQEAAWRSLSLGGKKLTEARQQ